MNKESVKTQTEERLSVESELKQDPMRKKPPTQNFFSRFRKKCRKKEPEGLMISEKNIEKDRTRKTRRKKRKDKLKLKIN